MSSEKLLSSVIFASTNELKELSSKMDTLIRVGLVAPLGKGLAKCHPAGKSRMGTTKAKISTFANICEMLLGENIFAIELQNSQVYVEYPGVDKRDRFTVTFNGSVMHCYGGVPTSNDDIAIPVAAYALASFSSMAETKENFASFVSKMNDSSSSNDDVLDALYKVCDAFYYEGVVGSVIAERIQLDDSLLIETVKEAIRTGGAKYVANILPRNEDSYPSRPTPPKDVDYEEDYAGASAASSTPSESKFESMKNGDYILNTYWDPNQRRNIVPLSFLETFIPTQTFYDLSGKISYEANQVLPRLDDGLSGLEAIKNNYINVVLFGPPGSGKTTMGQALSAEFGLPFAIAPIDKFTERSFATGETVVQEGGFSHIETPFLNIYKNGGIILIEEFNLAAPGVMQGSLGQAIEKPFTLLEDNVNPIHRHPLCIVIATMNPETEGIQAQSQALNSRFDPYEVDTPSEDDFIKVLQSQSKQPKTVCRKVHGIYNKILSYLVSEEIDRKDVALALSLRACHDTLKRITYGKSIKDAVRGAICNQIAISGGGKDLANEVYENVVKPARL